MSLLTGEFWLIRRLNLFKLSHTCSNRTSYQSCYFTSHLSLWILLSSEPRPGLPRGCWRQKSYWSQTASPGDLYHRIPSELLGLLWPLLWQIACFEENCHWSQLGCPSQDSQICQAGCYLSSVAANSCFRSEGSSCAQWCSHTLRQRCAPHSDWIAQLAGSGVEMKGESKVLRLPRLL